MYISQQPVERAPLRVRPQIKYKYFTLPKTLAVFRSHLKKIKPFSIRLVRGDESSSSFLISTKSYLR